MEQNAKSQLSGSEYLTRVFLRSEALHLAGDITGLLNKVAADFATIGNNPHHIGHGSDSKVVGNSLKGAYSPFRSRAITLKRTLVEQLDIEDSAELEFAFQDSISEEYVENQQKIEAAVQMLYKLAQQIDPTPPIVYMF